MSLNYQISTPAEYVSKLLDAAGYKTMLYGKRILENSCGDGSVLCEIVERYIKDAISNCYSNNEIVLGLEKDIVAYEIDLEKVSDCKKRLNDICRRYKINGIRWSIYTKDYLKEDAGLFDYIVGNPPYITYHDMTIEQRRWLNLQFKSCKCGRFDYYYAFIEKSLKSLNNTGVLAYLVPFSILRNRFAENIRNQLLPILTDIFDYSGISVFKDVISSSAIIVCDKAVSDNVVRYHRALEKSESVVEKKNLKEKWFFTKSNDGNKRFGDYYDVRNSIATLCNKAFLLSQYTEDDQYIYLGKKKIEKDITQKAVSAKSERNVHNNGLIIFPYKIIDGNLCRFDSEKEFKKTYPFAYKYLLGFKEELLKRTANEGVRWFEYGRTQALNHILGKKIIMSMVITRKVNLYECGSMDIPYAGYFIKPKNEGHSLEEAKSILESDAFLNYIRNHGTPTTADSYRLSVKEILNYIY